MDFFHPGLPEIEKLNIKSNLHLVPKNRLRTKELNFITEKLSKEYNFKLQYFNKLEDYNIWKPHLEYIRSFYHIEEKNTEDLVFHLRAGNMWVDKGMLQGAVPDASSIKKTIDSIKFKQLYVVTTTSLNGNFKKWTEGDYINLKKNLKHNGGDGEPKDTYINCDSNNPSGWTVNECSHKEVVDKINSILDVLNFYNPIWISKNIADDFDFITKFDKIICSPSTFSWWSGVFSNSNNIYMYKHWKNKFYTSLNKKSHKCKNLGETNYQGWLEWD